ncbi:MAG: RNA polymerase sigma factor RpoD/SigA [Planctomycetota bacterium]|jgi:RNA polymerase primary sigma factor|nr:RNA polymerase sigma factor RpoD/SigA [Planctomycetota bacterium]
MQDTYLDAYLLEIRQYPLLTPEKEVSLAKRVHAGDENARLRMVESNLRLVVSIAKHFTNRGLPLMDLISEGNIGLMKAVERYQPESNNRFSTYAVWWVKHYIRLALASKAKNIRIPGYMVDIVRRWKQVALDLSQRLERTASPEEIAGEMQLSNEKVTDVLKALSAATSSSVQAGASGNRSEEDYHPDLEDILASHSYVVSDSASEHDGETKLNRLLDCLPGQEKTIIRLRYGLGEATPLALQDISEHFQPALKPDKVKRMEMEALETLLRILDEEEGACHHAAEIQNG